MTDAKSGTSCGFVRGFRDCKPFDNRVIAPNEIMPNIDAART
jgi:hypothetical protein